MKRILILTILASANVGCQTAREKALQADLQYYQDGADEYRRQVFDRLSKAIEAATQAHAEGRPMNREERQELMEAAAVVQQMQIEHEKNQAQLERDLDRMAIQRQTAALESIATELRFPRYQP
jgi:hypothetical protein